MKDIKRLDYELMQVLIAIDEHRNCQNAAHALRISNSAMSRYLKQLREIFDDTLYIRRASGFIPTHKASQLLPMIRCRIPDDHISQRRYPWFVARDIMYHAIEQFIQQAQGGQST
ncbi:LysR family transcriptional regulator [Shewanella chilikensis]|uniref:helix-turn-helix domain-containing protein n=1 Tax=Shewanella chilikensis TaxID=558541 RepID=UPI00200EB390|nr:LysR family transcriptional regulator [Shewanella chilikensis]MCL1160735.1 LysR family transcriptional regulator [Shewanella chilikensis]